jgi:hypothetical protein
MNLFAEDVAPDGAVKYFFGVLQRFRHCRGFGTHRHALSPAMVERGGAKAPKSYSMDGMEQFK